MDIELFSSSVTSVNVVGIGGVFGMNESVITIILGVVFGFKY